MAAREQIPAQPLVRGVGARPDGAAARALFEAASRGAGAPAARALGTDSVLFLRAPRSSALWRGAGARAVQGSGPRGDLRLHGGRGALPLSALRSLPSLQGGAPGRVDALPL